MKIDDSQLATAPGSIPLWHFDEQKGYWKEDGVASKVGNKYIGKVSHFSWWNCDVFSSLVRLSITIVDVANNPLTGVRVGLSVNGINFNSALLYTNQNGQISGIIPAERNLTLNVYDICGNVISTSQIGPFGSDTVLPDIIINDTSTTNFTTVVGNLSTCNNTPVTNGYLLLNSGELLLPVTNGNFSFARVYCLANPQFTIIGADFDNFLFTVPISFNYTSPVTNINSLQVCSNVSEFIYYEMKGENATNIRHLIVSGIDASLLPSGFVIRSGSIYSYGESILDPAIRIFWNTNSPGIYNLPNSSLSAKRVWLFSGGGFNLAAFDYYGPDTTNLTIIVNRFGAVGEFIDLTFTGTTPDYNGIPTVINGTAHVIRDN